MKLPRYIVVPMILDFALLTSLFTTSTSAILLHTRRCYTSSSEFREFVSAVGQLNNTYIIFITYY